MRFLYLLIVVLAGSISGSTCSASGQVTDNEVATLSSRINSVEKVEQLYTIRYAVGKYASRADLTLRQQQLLMNSMLLLSAQFKIRSHFRNATDVHKEYLEFQKKYLISYNTYAFDSLMAAHKAIAEGESSSISSLNTRINELTKTRTAVSGLKNKYYSFGGFGAVAVIVISLIIGLSRNRAIGQANEQLVANRQKLIDLNKSTTDAMIAKGNYAFSKDTALVNTEILNSVIEYSSRPEEKPVFQKEIKALHLVVSKLSNLSA